jgi:hypothetical protein
MKFTSALLVMLALASCGTLKGLLDGAGAVLEGTASDLRSISNTLKR